MRFTPALVLSLLLVFDASAQDGGAPAPADPIGQILQQPSSEPMKEAAVRARLGEPTLARAEGAGAMWTYVTDACALHMFFRLDRDGRMKVNAAGAGPRRRTDVTPDVDDCVAGALAR